MTKTFAAGNVKLKRADERPRRGGWHSDTHRSALASRSQESGRRHRSMDQAHLAEHHVGPMVGLRVAQPARLSQTLCRRRAIAMLNGSASSELWHDKVRSHSDTRLTMRFIAMRWR